MNKPVVPIYLKLLPHCDEGVDLSISALGDVAAQRIKNEVKVV